ncbi:MAG TPA: hypothetical protein VFH61_02135, partial [Thermoleophilia bacterium]|nr:hypothetical protein [Thermoleophilia bacterium]
YRHSPGVPSKAASHQVDVSPHAVRLEAWGAQGGPSDGDLLGTPGAWSYTRAPNGEGPGTVAGGVLILPADANMEHVDVDFSPDSRDLATVYLATGPSARFGAGLPELSSGGLKSGFSWYADGDDLVFEAHDSGGGTTERLKVSNEGDVVIGGVTIGGGVKVVAIPEATTIPASDPVGGGVLYVESGALKYRSPGGTVSTIATN